MAQSPGGEFAGLPGRVRAGIVSASTRGRAASPWTQARLDDLVGDVPDDRQVNDCHYADEEPVPGNVGGPGGIKGAGGDGFFRNAEQQSVELAWRDIGRKPA